MMGVVMMLAPVTLKREMFPPSRSTRRMTWMENRLDLAAKLGDNLDFL